MRNQPVPRWVATGAAGALLACALAPASVMHTANLAVADTTQHVLGFALLAALWQAAGLAPRSVWQIVAWWLAWAIGVEAAQALWTTDRSATPTDALASTVGALAGTAAMRWRAGRDWPLAGVAMLLLAPVTTEVIAAIRAPLTDWLLQRAWTEARRQHQPQSPWPGAAARVAYTLQWPGAPRPLVIVDDDGPAALALAPGPSRQGARPGEPGMTLLIGHRNAAFTMLESLADGQPLTLMDAAGRNFSYVITRRDIVRWDQSGLEPDVNHQELALATCWPVSGRVRTPWRLVIRALPVTPLAALPATARQALVFP